MKRSFLTAYALTLLLVLYPQQTVFSAPEIKAESKPEITETSDSSRSYSFEIYINPMAAVYKNGIGTVNHTGLLAAFYNNFITGAGILYEYVNTDSLKLKIPAGYIQCGYAFNPGSSYRIITAVKGGGGYISVTKRSLESFAAGYLSPYLQIDFILPGTENLRFGADCAYELFIGREKLSGVAPGLYISYTF